MAQMLFDPVTGGISSLESSSVLTVHPLLDSQVFAPTATVDNATDDDDVFQCGRCKKQFTSIDLFLSHKKEGCSSSTINTVVETLQARQPAIQPKTVLIRNIQVPSTSLNLCTPKVVLSEKDLLSLASAGIDQSESQTSNIQITSVANGGVSTLCSNASLTNSLQSILPQLQVNPSISPTTKDLGASLLNNKVITRLFLMQQPTSDISGVVLNIADVAGLSSVESTEVLKEDTVSLETAQVNDVPNENAQPEDPSTVNVIAEFHNTMVKSKKKAASPQKEDECKNGNKLKCAYCAKSFAKNFDLQQHIRCHTGEKPFQCIVCGRAFAQKSNVKKHMQTHKVWPDGLSHTLPKHKRNKPNEEEDQDKPDDELENDLSSDAGESEPQEEVKDNSYACPYCTHITKSYYRLRSHMKHHDKKKVYKCIISTCGLMFSELDPFLDHTKSHENEMTYRCRECNKVLSTLYELGAHQYTHSLYPNQRSKPNQNYFRCALCLNRYSTPAALNHHLATTSHMYNCVHCEKMFPCERYLRRHLRIHSADDPFVCSVCKKGFKTDNYLKIHMVTHTNEKPFQCSICNSAFNRKDKLKRHLLIHEPVKRFKCPFKAHVGCTKEFSRADKLKAHILTHGSFKRYTCRTCSHSFNRLTLLREHMKFHKDPSGNTLQITGKNYSNRSEIEAESENSHDSLGSINANASQRTMRPKMRKDFALLHYGRTSRKRLIKKNSKTVVDISIADDIPTSHIEIISTDDQVASMAEISLTTAWKDSSMPARFQQAVNDVINNTNTPFCDLSLDSNDSMQGSNREKDIS